VNKESFSDKNTLWQVEELLLILFVSGRFHTLEDLLLLSEIFEKLFPDSWLIGFKANKIFLARQLEISQKNGYLIRIGSNFGISSEGRAFVTELIRLKFGGNENLLKILHLYRKMLWRLPRVRNQWSNYLEDFLRRLSK